MISFAALDAEVSSSEAARQKHSYAKNPGAASLREAAQEKHTSASEARFAGDEASIVRRVEDMASRKHTTPVRPLHTGSTPLIIRRVNAPEDGPSAKPGQTEQKPWDSKTYRSDKSNV